MLMSAIGICGNRGFSVDRIILTYRVKYELRNSREE